MRVLVLIGLVALAVAVDAYVLTPGTETLAVKNATSRANLNIGSINVGDRLLHRARVYRAAITNAIQTEDVIFRGGSYTRLTGIFAYEYGASQGAVAYLVAGGLGYNTATVRTQSATGRGYDYIVEFFGV